jgi:hypothetical protein
MTIVTTLSRQWKMALVLLVLLVITVMLRAQRSHAQSVAQIGTASPLPVFVTNAPSLPDGFVAGSRWKFTTWTTPSTFTWVTTVNRTSGAWAHLTIRGEDGSTNTRWYYVPGMPGSWEQQ